MAYDVSKPSDTGIISQAPAELRTNFDGVVNGQIVNAGTLKGLTVGNSSGQIAYNNGVLNVNCNVEKLGGNLASAFATAAHVHSVATSSTNGFLSNADKAKLDTVATNAQVNQNTFANVLINGTTIQSTAQSATLEIVPGTNIAITPDNVNKRVTIAVTGKVSNATLADTATTAVTATKLVTARTINGIAFDGSSNITITAAANGGTSAACSGNSATATTCTGNATTATTCTGNSATATTAGTCTGNSATATKLQTARTIAGVSFDGSANIAIPYSGLTGLPTIPADSAYDAGHLFAANGYQKFSNGLIIQWGRMVGGQNTFPIAFPTAALRMTTGNRPNYTSASGVGEVFSLAKTGFYVGDFGVGDSWKAVPDYIVIGY